MSKLNEIGSHKTSIRTENNFICVKYHNTDVIKFNDKKIILNSGGFYTLTTKTRINQTSNQYNLGLQVYQKKGNWFIAFNDKTIDFKDHIELKR